MEVSLMRLLLLSLLLLLLTKSTSSQNSNDLNITLTSFLKKLSTNPRIDQELGWTPASDPCRDRWKGIACNKDGKSVRALVLESLKLDGSIDGTLLSHLCNSGPLSILSLQDNALNRGLPSEISSCTRLTHVYLSNNRLSGSLPSSLPSLKSLKRLEISHNNFSGNIPSNMSRISGILTFLSNNNHFTGSIPDFSMNFMDEFDVSFNQFSGSVPANSEKFPVSRFVGNPGLCGKPLSVACPPPPSPPPLILSSPLPPSSPSSHKSKRTLMSKVVMVSGYVLLALVIILFLAYRCLKKKKNKNGPLYKGEIKEKKIAESSEKSGNPSRSEYSISSAAHSSEGVSTSLVMLKKDGCKDLKFEELLRAPAELLGKGRFGSLYKVVINGGAEYAVKRIKDWSLSGDEFKNKIMKMDQARHPNVLPITAFYCSKQEKLVVYDFQKNGSLYRLLHDNKESRPFTWKSRLNVAAGISAGLSFMHRSLANSGAATTAGHGNLKCSNILLSSTMDPLISEYGLTALPTHRHAGKTQPFSPTNDVYDLGVIFLELLTGKPSHGFNLAQWVHSVVREEWTVEVFDKSLLSDEEMVEETMMRLLQVALQCMNGDVNARPSMAEVAANVAGMME
ncbi:probable inactive receptor kinase At2g26730 [Phalaenopsis equestris]|uniref:probable inactive receptor kinase At2g26730 n=2 Tax=Phalaenopsis equestris TaxID=78828 RepID=UPI0009E4D8F2|nr:probable inactive receptor kinase At2g26730 [Phalaenopsis equestris]